MSNVVHEFFTQDNILESVDSGLDVFGPTVKNVVYFQFKTIFNLQRTDIVRKPEAFGECLRSFFGGRAFNVEAMIVASIVGRFRLAEVKQSDSVVRAITEARKFVWSEH